MTYDLADDSPQPPLVPPPPPPPAHGAAVPPPPSVSAPSPSQPQAPASRDRIIVLGRRAAGKTVFLARLYERLWTSKGDIHMAAVDGQTHLGLLSQIDAMEKKRWPASTEQLTHFKIDVTYRGEKYLMVALDYPGEVFRRAFMEGADEPAVRELLDNIDRAAAVIVLVDPGVMFEQDRIKQADQDFGLVAAIKRIRDWPGAETVPVAITLTKCDRFRDELEAEGGIAKFVKEKYSNLYRVTFERGRRGMVFAASAVRGKKDGLGREVPDLSKPPKGLVEPLEYCLKSMQVHRAARASEEQRERMARAAEEAMIAEQEADRKMARFSGWLIGGAIAVVLVALVLFLVWIPRLSGSGTRPPAGGPPPISGSSGR
jgi:hypothetical protein